MRKLYIIGASGHGKVVADIAKLNGFTDIYFLDDDQSKRHCGIYDVVGATNEVPKGQEVFVAVGNTDIRQHLCQKYYDQLVTLIHPSSVIADNVKIGRGTVIMAGAVVNPDSIVGDGCIINTSASVDHDNVIGNYSHISVGSHLAGTVHIGENCWIGIGAVVSNNIDICSDTTVGAGATVVRDITEPGTYIGVPAVKMGGYYLNSLRLSSACERQAA